MIGQISCVRISRIHMFYWTFSQDWIFCCGSDVLMSSKNSTSKESYWPQKINNSCLWRKSTTFHGFKLNIQRMTENVFGKHKVSICTINIHCNGLTPCFLGGASVWWSQHASNSPQRVRVCEEVCWAQDACGGRAASPCKSNTYAKKNHRAPLFGCEYADIQCSTKLELQVCVCVCVFGTLTNTLCPKCVLTPFLTCVHPRQWGRACWMFFLRTPWRTWLLRTSGCLLTAVGKSMCRCSLASPLSMMSLVRLLCEHLSTGLSLFPSFQ